LPAIIAGSGPRYSTYPTVQISAATSYSGYDEAADDYAHMLKSNPRFRSCFLYRSSSQFAAAVARVHYATDPYYGSKLTEIIRLYDLGQYDVQGRH
jgi:flagellum-specific peptidoglycan hydrolase FlgJ